MFDKTDSFIVGIWIGLLLATIVWSIIYHDELKEKVHEGVSRGNRSSDSISSVSSTSD